MSKPLVALSFKHKVASKGNLIIEKSYRIIEKFQNAKYLYFSTRLLPLLTKYEGDRSNSEISSPRQRKNLGLTPLTTEIFVQEKRVKVE